MTDNPTVVTQVARKFPRVSSEQHRILGKALRAGTWCSQLSMWSLQGREWGRQTRASHQPSPAHSGALRGTKACEEVLVSLR